MASESAWVVLEHDNSEDRERFSPTQHLAFPFHSQNERERGQSRLTPGLSLNINQPGDNFSSNMGMNRNALSPGLSLGPELAQVGMMRRRMLEAETQMDFTPFLKEERESSGSSVLSQVSVDSNVNNSENKLGGLNAKRRNSVSAPMGLGVNNNVVATVMYNGRSPPFLQGRKLRRNSFSLPNAQVNNEKVNDVDLSELSMMFYQNDSKEVREKRLSVFSQSQLSQTRADVLGVGLHSLESDSDIDLDTKDFVALLKQKQKERVDRQKQKKEKLKIQGTTSSSSTVPTVRRIRSFKAKAKPGNARTATGWIIEQATLIFRIAREYAIPMGLSHVLALMLGVYLGTKANSKMQK